MKIFFKKYIGLIISIILIIMFIIGHLIEPNNPRLGHVISIIPIWYAGFIILMVVLLAELKFLVWYDKFIDKLINKILKK
jgi:hypothetical protein